ncbi:hypothetical protein M430DRAFT_46142 [Amorphotheca resinae ATCC 22711]|uniref:Uncharacterized protein n=1 Tax=Amorphotheca resinae ATCC 22711 TaxID=857342 RepID=A0A2T3APF1_AMORE|nr:hypothetical protein M430DRAFT_46142 [Amorphotheca resinae ATCC 22711]PSS06805.1 hypothetical protein M430DRAFT_46142 [Amorphotheca resinae ATCC 22711]
MQPTTALRMFQPTRRMMRPIPRSTAVRFPPAHEEEELDTGDWNLATAVEDSWGNALQKLIDIAAHTVSQRLRTLKRIPPELVPLGVVVGIALCFGCYSLGKKLVVDKQIRLSRSNRE